MKFPSDDPKQRRKWHRLNRKRHALVDAKFSRGLTLDEKTRLRVICEKMEAIEAPYHEPALRLAQSRLQRAEAMAAKVGRLTREARRLGLLHPEYEIETTASDEWTVDEGAT